LIPYLILLLLVGKPMYYMEVAIGQFSQQGPLGIWKLSPLFTGKIASPVGTLTVWPSLQ